MDPHLRDNLNKVIEDPVFKACEETLLFQLKRGNKKNFECLIDIIARRYDQMGHVNSNLSIFDHDGVHVVKFVKDHCGVSVHFKKHPERFSRTVKHIKKDKKWYYNEQFGGYIRHTPQFVGTETKPIDETNIVDPVNYISMPISEAPIHFNFGSSF